VIHVEEKFSPHVTGEDRIRNPFFGQIEKLVAQMIAITNRTLVTECMQLRPTSWNCMSVDRDNRKWIL
jgi:hypothetical protein